MVWAAAGIAGPSVGGAAWRASERGRGVWGSERVGLVDVFGDVSMLTVFAL